MVTKTLASALKRVFGNGSVNSIASTSLVPYCNASGEPDGLSSISNLASVLGVSVTFVANISSINREGMFCCPPDNGVTPLNSYSVVVRSSIGVSSGIYYLTLEAWRVNHPEARVVGYLENGTVSTWYQIKTEMINP